MGDSRVTDCGIRVSLDCVNDGYNVKMDCSASICF